MNTRMFNWRQGKCSGLSKKMDIVFLNKEQIIYNKPLNEARTIYINSRLGHELILKFINNFLDLLDHSVNLIIAGEDYTFPKNTDKRNPHSRPFPIEKLNQLLNNNFINKIFVENLDSNLPKTYPIPLGINPRECSTNINYFNQYRNINIDKPLKITNFNRVRDGVGQWKERFDVLKLCETNWNLHYIPTGNLSHTLYIKELSKYLFTICVHGGGLDVNPKLFEALLVGVIPIIKENKPYTNIYLELDFPVVIIKDWDSNTITNDNLLEWKDKYYKYFTNKETYDRILNNLSLDFFAKYVSFINE